MLLEALNWRFQARNIRGISKKFSYEIYAPACRDSEKIHFSIKTDRRYLVFASFMISDQFEEP